MPDKPDLDLTAVDDEEAAALREHLAKLRRKKRLAAQLAEAQAAAAAAEAELAALDEGMEWSEEGEWENIENAPPDKKVEIARQQAEAARRLDTGPRSDFLKRAWGSDGMQRQARGLQEELRRRGQLSGRDRVVDPRIVPEARPASRAPEGAHVPGALSASNELPADYDTHVRVIPYQFRTRARNTRTSVDDASMDKLRRENPDWDWD